MKIQLWQAILLTIIGFLMYDHIVSCFTNEISIISYYILHRVKRNRQKKLIKGKEEAAIELILDEYYESIEKFGDFNSHHEGYAVIKEELDELWDAIKKKKKIPNLEEALQEEAVQVAAMALKFIVDFTEFSEKQKREGLENSENLEG